MSSNVYEGESHDHIALNWKYLIGSTQLEVLKPEVLNRKYSNRTYWRLIHWRWKLMPPVVFAWLRSYNKDNKRITSQNPS